MKTLRHPVRISLWLLKSRCRRSSVLYVLNRTSNLWVEALLRMHETFAGVHFRQFHVNATEEGEELLQPSDIAHR